MDFQKVSLIDMPGSIACVIFAQGCNRKCDYCHNPESQDRDIKGQVPFSEVFGFLDRRKGLLDAVVFSGGEPTLQHDLAEKIGRCIKLGYKIGLHTNGEGLMYKYVTPFCDYVLLSHPTPEKIRIASYAKYVQLSRVIKVNGNWENEITEI